MKCYESTVPLHIATTHAKTLGIGLKYHEMSGRPKASRSVGATKFILLTLPSADLLAVRRPRIKLGRHCNYDIEQT
jgi:hypothetical protein